MASSRSSCAVASFPLIPLGGERNLVDERGAIQSESRLYLPSLLLALFNSWGLVALLILFNRAYFESGHTMEKTGAALAMMVLLFGSWIWGGGLWRVPGMGRRTAIMAAVLGTRRAALPAASSTCPRSRDDHGVAIRAIVVDAQLGNDGDLARHEHRHRHRNHV